MLYHKLITLSIPCIVQVSKLHNDVTHSLTRKCLSLMQLPQYKDNSNYLHTKSDKINRVSAPLSKYLNNMNPIFKEKVIKNYLSWNVNMVDPYLISDNVSNKFSTLIKDDLLENMCYVIELNPGYGLLTRRLLEAGVPFMHLYESYDAFYRELQSLEAIFPNRVKITQANLLKMPKMLNLNRSLSASNSPNMDLCELYNNVPKRKWEDKSCMQVIGTVTKPLFIRHLIISVIFETGFMMHGRTIFYLAVSPSIWNRYTCCNKRNSTPQIMFKILFNTTMFGTLDRKGFLPWQQVRKLKTSKFGPEDDSEVLFVVKLEPNSNLLSLFGGREHLIYFWHFVRHYLYKPSSTVIPTLERVIPGFGERLVKKNYNIFTQFRELNIDQIIDLYMEFKSCPEFNESSFLSSGDDIRRIYDPYMEAE
ncbi:dimethyladenosine transferase 2, mitochondrial [Bombus vosnesenskii]|uniref:Dimethyladenosine transferase 2, mitochondrial n=1 Tax=Bombus vosnesenskii TaxID=207650 RepID=A0A6J3K675_9HYME|nr:dimethyladenosine transferase 2, mitochondrial [Bombus vosnesenskii]